MINELYINNIILYAINTYLCYKINTSEFDSDVEFNRITYQFPVEVMFINSFKDKLNIEILQLSNKIELCVDELNQKQRLYKAENDKNKNFMLLVISQLY